MIKLFLPIFMASACLLKASTVVWTANGTVSSTTGIYAAEGISKDTPLTIEMKYDDQAGKKVISSPVPTFQDLDFWNTIMLSIEITIEDRIWLGWVETSIEGIPASFLVRLRDFEDGAESLVATLQELDVATFESFPLESEPENNYIQLSFFSSGNTFLSDAITAESINVSEITSSSGFLQSGPANKVSFTLDPSSVVVKNEVLPPPVPVLALIRSNDNLAISWESVFDVNYQVQSSLSMEEGSWTDVGSVRFGNAGTLTQNVAIAQGFAVYYRVVAFPAPEL